MTPRAEATNRGSAASPGLLDRLETYYDEVPRAFTTAEDIGAFTLFLRDDPGAWPYYARPRLGARSFTPDDVQRVRQRQRDAGSPETFEWVAETTPQLGSVLRQCGLRVLEHPLMVLDRPAPAVPPAGVSVRVLSEEEPAAVLAAVTTAVGAGFEDVEPPDEVDGTHPVEALRHRLRGGRLRLVGAFDEHDRAVGGGTHSPRGTVTELTGIAVVPRSRSRGVGAALTAALVVDAAAHQADTVFLSAGSPQVADLYARLGFVRVATACTAEVDA